MSKNNRNHQRIEPAVETRPVTIQHRDPVLSVVLVQPCAIGWGNRKVGDVMATVSDDGWQPMPGVVQQEINTLAINPQLYEIKEQ